MNCAGAPVDLTPESDDPFFTDQTRIDNFRYDPLSQERCPFAAHTRKTNPRSDLVTTERHRILRRGIPFRPEVEEDESADRGLLFKAYQSRIDQGFQFIQKCTSLFPSPFNICLLILPSLVQQSRFPVRQERAATRTRHHYRPR
jgi:deferrochelatase/peroxidase EfeB